MLGDTEQEEEISVYSPCRVQAYVMGACAGTKAMKAQGTPGGSFHLQRVSGSKLKVPGVWLDPWQ